MLFLLHLIKIKREEQLLGNKSQTKSGEEKDANKLFMEAKKKSACIGELNQKIWLTEE